MPSAPPWSDDGTTPRRPIRPRAPRKRSVDTCEGRADGLDRSLARTIVVLPRGRPRYLDRRPSGRSEHLAQPFRQDLALARGEVVRELTTDGRDISRGRLPQRGATCPGQGRVRRAAVIRIGLAGHQPCPHQVVDDPAHPGAAHRRHRPELPHRETPSRRGVELEEDVVPGEWQAVGLLQFAVEAGHENGVHLEQRTPRVSEVVRHASTLSSLVRAHTLCYNYVRPHVPASKEMMMTTVLHVSASPR